MQDFRLTERDVTLFNELGRSAFGKNLKDYLGRLINALCDIRTMDAVDEQSRKARIQAVAIVEQWLIDKMTHSASNGGATITEYE